MARVTLCDRCGVIIKDSIRYVGFSSNSNDLMTRYEVCNKCYNELNKFMKIKEKKKSNE